MLPAQAHDLVRFRAVDEEEKREHPKFDPEGLAPVAERGTRFVSEGEYKRELTTAQVWVPELTPPDSFQLRTAGSPWENPDTDALTP